MDRALVYGTFAGAQPELARVRHYLSGSIESADDPFYRQVDRLYMATESTVALWRRICRIDTGAATASPAASVRDADRQLTQAYRLLPVNSEGNKCEQHIRGVAEVVGGLITLADQATGQPPRTADVLRKSATSLHRESLHRYGLAFQAPDTNVTAVRTAANYENRVELVRRFHRALVSIAEGVKLWSS